MNTEPRISINGTDLDEGEAMTIRVALESFALDLANNGLGSDEHGRTMTRLYRERLDRLRVLIHHPTPETSAVADVGESCPGMKTGAAHAFDPETRECVGCGRLASQRLAEMLWPKTKKKRRAAKEGA